jgi:hypothetical protein
MTPEPPAWEVPGDTFFPDDWTVDEIIAHLDATAPPTLCHEWDMDRVRGLFYDFLAADSRAWKADPNAVYEERDANRYNVTEHGLPQYVYELGHAYNPISNAFHEAARLECAGYDVDAPAMLWRERATHPQFARRIVPYFLRPVNTDGLTMQSVRAAFRLAGYTATQFKVGTARAIYDDLCPPGGTVCDPSMGWGDRLAGFFGSHAHTYVGTDPATRTARGYVEQAVTYCRWLDGADPTVLAGDTTTTVTGKTKRCVLMRWPSEDAPWEDFGPFDLTFTSPPYFATERYDAGTPGEREQSWFRYRTTVEWFGGYLIPTFSALARRSALVAVNVRNGSGPSAEAFTDDFVDAMRKVSPLAGIGGLRMKGRPSTTQAQTGPARLLVEPIYIFGTPPPRLREQAVQGVMW